MPNYQLLKDRTVIYAGDSRVAVASQTVRESFGYPSFPEGGDLLVNRYQINKNGVLNQGVPGAGSSFIASRTGFYLASKPMKVIIQVGIIDINWVNNAANWTSILTALSTVPYVYVMEPMYATPIGYQTLNTLFNTTLYTLANQQSYNTSLKALAATFPNVKWLDLNKYVIDNTGYLAEVNTFDGLHPTYACYQQWWKSLDPVSFF
jgi:lysophospholipase L1-like esterase